MIDFTSYRRKFDDNHHYLSVDDLPNDPITLVESWLQYVQDQQILDGNAMVLSTASSNGKVTSRVVLLKYMDNRGFVFFTNYKSQKSKDLLENSSCSLNFYWPSLNRQIIVIGKATKLPTSESAKYFFSRPRLNQLFALSSKQGTPIKSIEEVTEKAEKLDQEYQNTELPYETSQWGGFLVSPQEIEFWQGGQGRLNIRHRYRQDKNTWNHTQLSP